MAIRRIYAIFLEKHSDITIFRFARRPFSLVIHRGNLSGIPASRVDQLSYKIRNFARRVARLRPIYSSDRNIVDLSASRHYSEIYPPILHFGARGIRKQRSIPRITGALYGKPIRAPGRQSWTLWPTDMENGRLPPTTIAESHPRRRKSPTTSTVRLKNAGSAAAILRIRGAYFCPTLLERRRHSFRFPLQIGIS